MKLYQSSSFLFILVTRGEVEENHVRKANDDKPMLCTDSLSVY